MENRKYSYNTGSYFPTGFQVLGYILIVLSLNFLFTNLFTSVLLALPALTILTCHFKVEFDLIHNTYRDGIWVLGFFNAQKKRLPGFDFLYFKENIYKQSYSTRVSSTTTRKKYYEGYLRLSDGKRIQLVSSTMKEKSFQKLNKIAKDLQLEIKDLCNKGLA